MKEKIAFLMLSACLNTVSAQDLFDLAGDSREISTFLQVVRTAGMEHILRESGPYTVFAPEDSAFQSMPRNERAQLMSDQNMARQVLSDHIVRGKVSIAEIRPGTTETIDGSEISLESDNGLVKVENASVILSDIAADNGVIHVVDAVIRPSR
ncbi:fasciclin domain-containing protein [Noviherbaspirillum sp. CPCC 100848]|uniref:Fasciclin domain-containing protein n=1 Tax=Noviherbaspirillum album TaxID=3080276 RepID=A0ABU6J243_9BURK|nr:fasciclin domain-containing protein [Noviherbaspirillum sp. CPCC 100848]MEC4717691.1 fasciclin domain-containing protein [Noviherbaspirillum sp. CPCC 100848]